MANPSHVDLLPSLYTNVPVLVGVITGFALGFASRQFLNHHKPNPIHPSDEDSDTEDSDSPIAASHEEYRLMLCVRTDLKMQKGKIAAQVGHATLGAYKRAQKLDAVGLRIWEHNAQPKIALQVPSEEEAMQLRSEARKRGLVTFVVYDAGRTQVAAGSMTVLAIGPGPRSIVDQVTGGLKLL